MNNVKFRMAFVICYEDQEVMTYFCNIEDIPETIGYINEHANWYIKETYLSDGYGNRYDAHGVKVRG